MVSSSSVLLAVVSAVEISSAFADPEALSLLQTSSNKVVHAHDKTGFPDSTWPEGYVLPPAKLDDGSKVFGNNQEWSLCSKGWTPGMAYSARLNNDVATDKYFGQLESSKECVEQAEAEPACKAQKYTAVNYDINEGHCWCKGPATHNEYMSWTRDGALRVTCMLSEIPYDGSKSWELFGGDKKVKFMRNALQGDCAKNQWVLGTSVAKAGGAHVGYVELGRLNGGQEEVFYKTPSECITAAAADDRCGEATAVNFHFISETKNGFQTDGEPKGPVEYSGEEAGKCYCTGHQGPPQFTRKNWVNVLSCMTAAPSYGDEEESGPKPDKETCNASKARFKAAKAARKTSRAAIKALREQLRAEKAKWQAQHLIVQEEKSTVKACRR